MDLTKKNRKKKFDKQTQYENKQITNQLSGDVYNCVKVNEVLASRGVCLRQFTSNCCMKMFTLYLYWSTCNKKFIEKK